MLCADLPASVVRITRKHVIYELADFYSAAPAPYRHDGESISCIPGLHIPATRLG